MSQDRTPKLRVHNFSLSLDGCAAGPNQSADHPLGVGGHRLHEWAFATRTFRQMHGMDGGGVDLDDAFAARGQVGIGATIMGRNMFGPIRGPWGSEDSRGEPDGLAGRVPRGMVWRGRAKRAGGGGGWGAEGRSEPFEGSHVNWKGWWGDNPPFHHPVFVLTHHSRPSITMRGGTTFYFVTDGIRAALDRALEAADGNDVGVGGGAATIQQYLRAGLIDEMHLVIVPILLGSGERLFDHLDGGPYKCVEFLSSPSVVHVRFTRS
jgi:dihydrofolate reductase